MQAGLNDGLYARLSAWPEQRGKMAEAAWLSAAAVRREISTVSGRGAPATSAAASAAS
jgi:hypothetical protein